jgi:hypothetical protein
LLAKVSTEDKESDDENDSDFDCVDSDYEVSKGDDDLYADNVGEKSDGDQVQSSVLKRKFASAKGKVQNVESCASKDKDQTKTQIEDDESDEEDPWAAESNMLAKFSLQLSCFFTHRTTLVAELKKNL